MARRPLASKAEALLLPFQGSRQPFGCGAHVNLKDGLTSTGRDSLYQLAGSPLNPMGPFMRHRSEATGIDPSTSSLSIADTAPDCAPVCLRTGGSEELINLGVQYAGRNRHHAVISNVVQRQRIGRMPKPKSSFTNDTEGLPADVVTVLKERSAIRTRKALQPKGTLRVLEGILSLDIWTTLSPKRSLTTHQTSPPGASPYLSHNQLVKSTADTGLSLAAPRRSHPVLRPIRRRAQGSTSEPHDRPMLHTWQSGTSHTISYQI